MSQTKVAQRPGISDFVPEESRFFSFATVHHPGPRQLSSFLNRGDFQSLLDTQRLLALTELVGYSADQSEGDIIELGVYKGGSAAAIAWTLQKRDLTRNVHLCDTFEGMPQTLEWEFHKRYDFADTSLDAVSGRLAKIAPDFPFVFHRGLFSETLPTLSERRFCFAHIDADLYQSVREACEFVYPRMAKGGVILFDDYGAPTCPGAKKAVDEFFAGKLERPTHVSRSAYGVRIGAERTDFHRLLGKRTFGPALLRAAYRWPLQAVRRSITGVVGQFASPRAVRILSGQLSRGGAKTSTSDIAVQDARSILVIRPDTIGDLVLMSSFLRELRRSSPHAWISLVVSPEFLNLVQLCPHVDEVQAFDLNYCGRPVIPGLVLRALRLSRQHLRSRQFDMALVPRWGVDLYHSAYVAHFSGASCRVGFSENVLPQKQQMNRDFDTLFTRTLDDRTCKHELERNLDFLREVGGTVTDHGLELWLSSDDRETAKSVLVSHGITPADLVIGLAPGAGAPKRAWPLVRFVELGRKLQQDYGARLVVVGGTEDRDRAARLQQELGATAVNVAGDMTIRQTAALFEHTALVIANDSGPMHLAAAAGAAIIEISCHPVSGDPIHSNSPVRFHPWAKEYIVVQPAEASAPCANACEWHEAHCILGVSVQAVQQAAISLLARMRPTRASRAGAQQAG